LHKPVTIYSKTAKNITSRHVLMEYKLESTRTCKQKCILVYGNLHVLYTCIKKHVESFAFASNTTILEDCKKHVSGDSFYKHENLC